VGINKNRGKKTRSQDRKREILANQPGQVNPAGSRQALTDHPQPGVVFRDEDQVIKDMDILSIVVSDALAGVNVATRYPGFYKKMMRNHELRSAFLDALELLESEKAGLLDDLPVKSTAMPYLGKTESKPAMNHLPANRWRLTWTMVTAQLQTILSPLQLGYGAAYRGSADLLEDNWLTLLRSTTRIGDVILDVFLEAAQQIDQSDRLQLMAILNWERAEDLPLKATLQWGNYQSDAVFDPNGRAEFTPVLLKDIWDEEQKAITQNLMFSLETLH
jgi:hypothetical protein